MSTAARTVGFVGLGHMGFGMASNLLCPHLAGPRALPAHRRQARRTARLERGAALLPRTL